MEIKEFLENLVGTNVLIGKNGSGKSTFFNYLSINDKDKIYYHRQEPYFIKDMTFLENIQYFEKLFNQKIEKELLTDYNQKILSTKAKDLSGGEKQILSLFLTTLSNKEYLLLDEVDSELDVVIKEKIYFEKILLNKLKNRVVFTITHDMNSAKKFDNIYYLSTVSRKPEFIPKPIFNTIINESENQSEIFNKLEEYIS